MANQTIATVPADISDDINLKRFLLELIENLDVVLGYKGDAEYVSKNDLASAAEGQDFSIAGLTQKVDEALKEIEELKEGREELVEQLDQLAEDLKLFESLLKTDSLGSTYYDFNDAAWGLLKGKGEFTTDGANISNSPFAVAGGTDYTVYADSTETNDGVLQEIVVVVGTTIDKYIRVAVGSNWIHLAKV